MCGACFLCAAINLKAKFIIRMGFNETNENWILKNLVTNLEFASFRSFLTVQKIFVKLQIWINILSSKNKILSRNVLENETNFLVFCFIARLKNSFPDQWINVLVFWSKFKSSTLFSRNCQPWQSSLISIWITFLNIWSLLSSKKWRIIFANIFKCITPQKAPIVWLTHWNKQFKKFDTKKKSFVTQKTLPRILSVSILSFSVFKTTSKHQSKAGRKTRFCWFSFTRH